MYIYIHILHTYYSSGTELLLGMSRSYHQFLVLGEKTLEDNRSMCFLFIFSWYVQDSSLFMVS